MRRIAIAVMSTISGLVLLFSYHTSLGSGGGSSTTTLPDPNQSTPADTAAADSGAASPGATDPGAATQQSAGANTVSGTFTGDVVDTQWGPCQVRIVVKNSKIGKATAVQFPNGNHHDDEINSWAVPQLQQATVAVNGAGFDALSGATVTSEGYRGSLQSALDKAHL